MQNDKRVHSFDRHHDRSTSSRFLAMYIFSSVHRLHSFVAGFYAGVCPMKPILCCNCVPGLVFRMPLKLDQDLKKFANDVGRLTSLDDLYTMRGLDYHRRRWINAVEKMCAAAKAKNNALVKCSS